MKKTHLLMLICCLCPLVIGGSGQSLPRSIFPEEARRRFMPDRMDPTSEPNFAELTIAGLTGSRLVSSDANSLLVSVGDFTAWIAGTADQVIVTDDGDGTLTLSLPQDVNTTSSPTFAGLTLTLPDDVNDVAKTDGSGNIFFDRVEMCEVRIEPNVPVTMSVVTGTLTAGTVVGVQTWADSNSVNITEVAGVPGFDVQFTFTDVNDFCVAGVSGYYTGTTASHYCEIQLYDEANTTWRTLWTFSGGLGFNYRFSDIPVSEVTRADYIDGSDVVKMRFYHPTSGNASHNLWIDYMTLSK